MPEMWIFMVKVLALGSTLLMLAVALLARRIVGSWVNAASIFSLFWFVYTALPLVLAWDVPVNLGAVLYIVFFDLFFASSVFFFDWAGALRANENKSSAYEVFGSRLLMWTLFLSSALTVLFTFQGMRLQGIEFTGNIFEFAGGYAALRYAGELNDNAFSKLGVLFNFFVIVLGGLVWGAARGKKLKGISLFASFAPALFLMIAQSAKGPFLLSIAMFFGAVLVTRVYDKKYYFFDAKSAASLAKWGGACFVLVMITFLSRGVSLDEGVGSAFNLLWGYFLSYSSGHLYAFSDWFSSEFFGESRVSYDQVDSTWGFYSFMSFFRMLGDDRVVPFGTYEEVFDYHGEVVTNVYTAFRGVIADFSLIGSLLVGWLAGFFSNGVCFGLYKKRSGAFFVVAFAYFFGFSYQSFGVSTFTWVSVPVSFVLLVLFFSMYFGLTGRGGVVAPKVRVR